LASRWGLPGCHTIERYLLDQLRNRLGFPETVMARQSHDEKAAKANLKLVEDKANGPRGDSVITA
jgi:phage terminase large subunit-like protein